MGSGKHDQHDGGKAKASAETRAQKTIMTSTRLGELFADMFLTCLTQSADKDLVSKSTNEPAKWMAMMCKFLSLGMTDILGEESAEELRRSLLEDIDAEFLPGGDQALSNAEGARLELQAGHAFNRLFAQVALYAAFRRMLFHKMLHTRLAQNQAAGREEPVEDSTGHVLRKLDVIIHEDLHERLGHMFLQGHREANALMMKAFAAAGQEVLVAEDLDDEMMTQSEGEA